MKSDRASLAEIIGKIRGALFALPQRDLSALRRWRPGQPLPLAVLLLDATVLRETDSTTEHSTPLHVQKWASIASMIATLADLQAEYPRLGDALAAAEFSVDRMNKLLLATDETLLDEAHRAVSFLLAKGVGTSGVDLARLILAGDDKREESRRAIAGAFFSARHAASVRTHD